MSKNGSPVTYVASLKHSSGLRMLYTSLFVPVFCYTFAVFKLQTHCSPPTFKLLPPVHYRIAPNLRQPHFEQLWSSHAILNVDVLAWCLCCIPYSLAGSTDRSAADSLSLFATFVFDSSSMAKMRTTIYACNDIRVIWRFVKRSCRLRPFLQSNRYLVAVSGTSTYRVATCASFYNLCIHINVGSIAATFCRFLLRSGSSRDLHESMYRAIQSYGPKHVVQGRAYSIVYKSTMFFTFA